MSPAGDTEQSGAGGLRNRPIATREYREDDWHAVCTVHDRARPGELSGSCDPRAFVALAQERSDAESFRRSRKFVACLGEKVVGFVGVEVAQAFAAENAGYPCNCVRLTLSLGAGDR